MTVAEEGNGPFNLNIDLKSFFVLSELRSLRSVRSLSYVQWKNLLYYYNPPLSP